MSSWLTGTKDSKTKFARISQLTARYSLIILIGSDHDSIKQPTREGHLWQLQSNRRRLWWVTLLNNLWSLDSRLPSLWSALSFDLHHKECQNHHGTKECKDGDGSSHVLVVASRHYPCTRKQRMRLQRSGNKIYGRAMESARQLLIPNGLILNYAPDLNPDPTRAQKALPVLGFLSGGILSHVLTLAFKLWSGKPMIPQRALGEHSFLKVTLFTATSCPLKYATTRDCCLRPLGAIAKSAQPVRATCAS